MIRLDLSGNDLHQCGFAASVRSDDPEPLIFQHDIIKIVDQLILTVTLGNMMQLDRLFPHTDTDRVQLHLLLLRRRFPVFQRLQTLQTCPLLCTSCPTSPLRPLQFHSEHALPFSLRREFHLFPLRFQLQKSGIIFRIAIHFSMIDLQYLIRHPIQEITVVRNHDQHTFKPVQILFQPHCHLIVYVVRRLIQHEYICRIHQSPCQRDPFFLSAGQRLDLRHIFGDAKSREHGFRFTLRVPVLLPLPIRNIIQYICPLRKLRILRKIRNAKPVLADDLPVVRLFQTCDHL